MACNYDYVDRSPSASQLLDVMYQAVSLPLPIDLDLSVEREPGQPLVVAQIAKCRLHRRKASAVSHPAYALRYGQAVLIQSA